MAYIGIFAVLHQVRQHGVIGEFAHRGFPHRAVVVILGDTGEYDLGQSFVIQLVRRGQTHPAIRVMPGDFGDSLLILSRYYRYS